MSEGTAADLTCRQEKPGKRRESKAGQKRTDPGGSLPETAAVLPGSTGTADGETGEEDVFVFVFAGEGAGVQGMMREKYLMVCEL